eukprot:scpid100057/ scgid11820/ 
MPRQVFTEEIEAKLIQLWGEYVKNKSGTMVRRSVKEKEIGEALTRFARQLDNTDVEFTASVVHHKIDNLKAKAKEHYKKYRKMTATGSPAGMAWFVSCVPLLASQYVLIGQQLPPLWDNFHTVFPICLQLYLFLAHLYSRLTLSTFGRLVMDAVIRMWLLPWQHAIS